MARYRDRLPQMRNRFFLTDGGLETTLIFREGIDLPDFAAFTLLGDERGEERLRDYYRRYGEVAGRYAAGLVLESATWRASADWGARLGYDARALAEVNRRSIALLEEIRAEVESAETPVVISGCIGPRGDGYTPGNRMGAREAESYHAAQIETLAGTSADLVSAFTLTYAEEAVGIARAARVARIPVVLSFTLETDGRLPAGEPLGQAIDEVDDATSGYPSYYMINCAHPSHFADVLAGGGSWVGRVRGVRANASRRSHAELNEATELDAGDPVELGAAYADLRRILPWLAVLGGCCGTDEGHAEQIAAACAPLFHPGGRLSLPEPLRLKPEQAIGR